jgi:hypothetical protein
MIRHDHIRMDPAYRARLRDCGLDTVERVLSRVEGRVAAWSRTTDTLLVAGPDGVPGYYIKRHFFPTWSKRLRGTFRGTFLGKHRGHAECLALNALRAAGVPAVRPVAYGGRRVAHFLVACFLITEEVPYAQNLTSFAQEVAEGRRLLPRPRRLALIERLADELANLHSAGLSHGNLFWRNVLIRSAPDGRPEFFYLDVQPLPRWAQLSRRGDWWRRELAQTMVSALPFTTRADRLRFVCRYLNTCRPAPQHKVELAEITRLAASWERHERRRIRMNGLFEEWNRQLVVEERRATTASEGSCG